MKRQSIIAQVNAKFSKFLLPFLSIFFIFIINIIVIILEEGRYFFRIRTVLKTTVYHNKFLIVVYLCFLSMKLFL